MSQHIITSGGVFTHHFIESLEQDQHAHKALRPESFELPNQDSRLTEDAIKKQIADAWEALVARWDALDREKAWWSMDISEKRRRWMRPLFYHLNIEPEFQRGDTVLEDDMRFPISHLGRVGTTEFTIPIHSVKREGEDTLDTKAGKGRGIKNLAPHDMLQRYLNLSKDHIWAIVTDGLDLRLLRDYHHTYTRGYVEFDLYGMFASRDYKAFRALYRLLHGSRFVLQEGEEQTPIDQLYDDALAMGVKVGEDLRKNVLEAIETLANGFLSSTPGLLAELRELPNGAELVYKDVLMTIYRMLFLLFAEQHGMLPARDTLYGTTFSLTAFRTLAEQPPVEDRSLDLWETFKTTVYMVEHGVEAEDIFPYNGALFSTARTPILTPKADDPTETPNCRNDAFLTAIRNLTVVLKDKVTQRISYADLSVEEIGSIYESLLEFTPRISESLLEVDGREVPANSFFLDPRGLGRKTTGSYYTPPSLVNELIKSALVPVMEARIQEVVPGYDSESVEALNDDERQAAEKALLAMNVVDPAAGSGAFMIAANNKLGLELARIRTGEVLPSENDIREARRDVLAECIYAVDLNPMAVELCKVSLWINAAVKDQRLNFLDHHIKCGNSLVGASKELIEKGVPNDAYKPVTGDDKAVSRQLIARNREELKGQMSIWKITELATVEDVRKYFENSDISKNDPARAEQEYNDYYNSEENILKHLPYDMWCAAFFVPQQPGVPVPTTQDVRQALSSPKKVEPAMRKLARDLAKQERFFHWEQEFPEVFGEEGRGGFDVVLGNPPWERVKLQEKEFFAGKDEEITNAPNAAARKRLIAKLPKTNPGLWKEYQAALRGAEGVSKFLRDSDVYPLTGRGDVNTYQVFSGRDRWLMGEGGRAGFIVPTGIATDDTNKLYFADLVETGNLVSLFDFENRKKLFPAVDSRMKFSLLTLQNAVEGEKQPGKYAFFLLNVEDLQNPEKVFTLTSEDFNLLNPNTKTCPIFRNRTDAALTRKLYQQAPVLVNEKTGENPWGISFMRMFDMANDSNLFKTHQDLIDQGFEFQGNIFVKDEEIWLPLYESKMFHQFDHRHANIEFNEKNQYRPGQPVQTTLEDHQNPNFYPRCHKFVSKVSIENRLDGNKPKWLFAFKRIVGVTNERTMSSTFLPGYGASDSMTLLFSHKSAIEKSCLLGNLNSFLFDYISRLKISATTVNHFVIQQLPLLPPKRYSMNIKTYIFSRVFQLIYTSWDMFGYLIDVLETKENQFSIEDDKNENQIRGLPDWLKYFLEINSKGKYFNPFIWDEEKRHKLFLELNAIFGHLYDLTRDEFDYILETFPIVKRKDIDQYGEFRTKRVILEEFDKLADDPMLEGVCTPLKDRVSVIVGEEPHPTASGGHLPLFKGKDSSRTGSAGEGFDSDTETAEPLQKAIKSDNNASLETLPDEMGGTTQDQPPLESLPPVESRPEPVEESAPPASSDYGLYRCPLCKRLIMGFGLEEHTREVHGGKAPDYEKVG